MPLGKESLHVAIAGATSLLGQDLKQWIEESGFPAGAVLLFDEPQAAGTLTKVGGEPTVVQPVDEASFEHMRFVFFAGSAEFAAQHGAAAERAGATVIDMTGGLAATPRGRRWIPRLDAVLVPPATSGGITRQVSLCLSPSAPAIVACSLSAALAELSLTRLVIIFCQPVSERGKAGIEELEGQTVKLLSLQSIPQEVFDTQVAFNLLDRWGTASRERLSDARAALTREVRAYLDGRAPMPAMTLVQAPVFYGHTFAAYAEFSALPGPELFAVRLAAAGFKTVSGDEPGPSNVSVAGEAQVLIGPAERDPNIECGCWFWGAADNLRLATANATQIAERLLVS
jgi:aspartate-semialdehyde dehydrogenase